MVSQVSNRWQNHLPWPVGLSLASTVQYRVAVFDARTCYLLLFNFLSTRTLRAFSAELLPSQWALRPVLVHGATLSEMRDFAFELHVVPVCPFLQSVKITLSSSTISGSLTTLHNLVSPLCLLTGHSCLTVQILKEMLNRMTPVGLPEGCHL